MKFYGSASEFADFLKEKLNKKYKNNLYSTVPSPKSESYYVVKLKKNITEFDKYVSEYNWSAYYEKLLRISNHDLNSSNFSLNIISKYDAGKNLHKIDEELNKHNSFFEQEYSKIKILEADIVHKRMASGTKAQKFNQNRKKLIDKFGLTDEEKIKKHNTKISNEIKKIADNLKAKKDKITKEVIKKYKIVQPKRYFEFSLTDIYKKMK
jgi:hypothetical protein